MPRILRALHLATLVLTLLSLAAPAGARRHGRHRRVASLPTGFGLVAARDPITGALVAPSRAQLFELSAREQTMLSRSTAGLEQRRLANGGVALELAGRFQEFTVVRLGPGGGKTFRCLDNAAELRQPFPDGSRSGAAEEK